MLARLLLTFSLLMVVGGADPAPLTLRATPEQSYPPSTISIMLRIPPHRDNIMFCTGYDGPDEYRKSCQELNGQYSPRVFYFEYHLINSGEYKAFAELYRAPNYLAETTTANFVILTNTDSPTPPQ